MDIQDKIYINYIFRKEKKVIDLENITNGEILFSFNEYEPIIIETSAENYNITIECLSYYKDGEYINCENNLLTLKKGIEYKISDSNNLMDIGYIPSKYQIFIKNDCFDYECLFEVDYNNQLSEEGIVNIIDNINDFINGLSIDFFRNQPVNNICSNSELSEYYIYEILSRNNKKIIHKCEKVMANLKHSIIVTDKKENYEKKQNNATLRKNNLKIINNYYYNLKKVISNNNIENVLLKKYLFKTLKIINNYQCNINKIIEKEIIKKYEIESKLNNCKKQLETTKMSKADKQDIENSKISIINEIDTINKWIRTLQKWHLSYKSCILFLRKLYDCDELKSISINNITEFSLTFFKNEDYSFFSKLYNELLLNKTNKHKANENNIFSDKRTYILFEIYGFILIQNILKELGFEFLNDKWDLFTFGSDLEFEFIKENIKIKVQYDHYCEKYRNSNNVRIGDIVNINSRNCKPDYILSLYINDELINAIVVEMKYRKLRYMVDNNGGSTETDATIDDYSQLGGILNDLSHPKNIISDVIILYPSESEKIFEHNNGTFIGINANKDFNKSAGYNKLKQIIIKTSTF